MINQPDQNSSLNIIKEISKLLDVGGVGVAITVMTGKSIGAKLLVVADKENSGSLGDAELDRLAAERAGVFLESREDTRTISVEEFAPEFPNSKQILLLFERIQTPPTLVICGAGHVGAALAKLGSFLGYQTTLIDDRAEFVTPDRFESENINLVVAENWGDAVRRTLGHGKGVAIAVVTRGHNQDEECMHAIATTTPDYVGLIGSKRRTNIVIENLRRAGVPEDQLKSIHAPIGLDIRAVSPEEVALAIIAEIVAERRGGPGGSLSAWRRQ